MHGDFRIDNTLLGKQMPPTVQAVLDWELSTLGEPLADLGLFLFYWREPTDARPALTPAPTMQPGFPSRAYLAERYAPFVRFAAGIDAGVRVHQTRPQNNLGIEVIHPGPGENVQESRFRIDHAIA